MKEERTTTRVLGGTRDVGRIARETKVEIIVFAIPRQTNPIEADLTSTRGFAVASLGRGADAIYLFNYLDPASMTGGTEAYRALLHEGLGIESTIRNPRRHVVTYRDTVPPDMSNGVVLPQAGFKGTAFRIHIGPAHREAEVTVITGLEQSRGMEKAQFEISVNGKPCTPALDLVDTSVLAGVARDVRHHCTAVSLRDGYNEVHIRQLAGSPEQKIVWVELRLAPQ